MMTPFDAWVVARLRSDQPVEGDDLGIVSEAFRPLANRLHGMDADRRDDSWQGFLEGRNGDTDAIIRAVVDADPNGPRPEPSDSEDEADDGWGPIRFASLPTVDPFPLGVLPPAARDLVVEGSEAIGCQPDFLAVSVLVAASGTIGRSVSLLLKADYFASSSLFVACVGPPSDGKSPAIQKACSAVRKIDEALKADHDRAMDCWQVEQNAVGSMGKKPKPTAPPRPGRIDLDDITMEALPLILADNPRGLVLVKDELAGLMLGLNQYKGGKGSDRQTLLSVWSGKAIKRDRVSHEANIPIRCPHPCLSIVGAMTPDMLGSMADAQGRADGFLDRFLFAYPESRPISGWTDRGIDDATIDEWSALVARLWERPLNVVEGRSVPHVARLEGEALSCWNHHYNLHAVEMNSADFSPNLRGPWGKIGEYAGRFVLVLACLDHASDPTADPTEAPQVSPQTVIDAWALVSYFKSHLIRVHAAMGGKAANVGGDVQALLGWIKRGRKEGFSIRDAKREVRRFKDDPAALQDALDWMTRRNIIRPCQTTENEKSGSEPKSASRRGRKPLAKYQVNPAFWEMSRNRQNRQNSERFNDFGNSGNSATFPDGQHQSTEGDFGNFGNSATDEGEER